VAWEAVAAWLGDTRQRIGTEEGRDDAPNRR
jgi:hypothetical protein